MHPPTALVMQLTAAACLLRPPLLHAASTEQHVDLCLAFDLFQAVGCFVLVAVLIHLL